MLTTFQKAVLATLVGGAVAIALVLAARGPAVAATLPALAVMSGGGGIAPGIVTVGDATVKVKPDIAILAVGATAQAPTAAGAQALVAQRIDRILAAAKAVGIADKDVATAGYHIEPIYIYDKGQPPQITGYQATQMLSLKLRVIAEAGKALDALVQNDGATNASVTFALEDPKATQAEARRLAVEDAKAKADAMARTAGVGLGTVLAISDTTPSYFPYEKVVAAPMPAADGRTQIPVGDLEIAVHVQVQFAIR